ncbi:MAG: cadherin-like domain-containing protein [Bacteroidia bacterium]|nr:cadherin-like domain-containing protein [Bacteroidia bacterium]
MKQIIIVTALFLTLLNSNSKAQVLGTFEQWDNRFYLLAAPPIIPIELVSYSDPEGWTSLNQLTQSNFFGNKANALQDTNSVEGSFSAKIVSDTIAIAGLGTFPLPGVLINGEFSIDLLSLILGGGNVDPLSIADIGEAYDQKPSKFSGYYRYNPVGSDSCLFTVILISDGEPIGGAVFASGQDTDSSFVYFEAPVEYFGCGVPDTLIVIATSSSAGLAGGNVGSTLYVDSIGLFVPPGGVNTGVIARDDTMVTVEDSAVVVQVLSNDEDCDEDPLTLVAIINQPSNGSTIINIDGSITYTPNNSYTGQDQFTYVACDPDTLCDTANATIIVQKNTGIDRIDNELVLSYNYLVSQTLEIRFIKSGTYNLDIFQIDGRIVKSIETMSTDLKIDLSMMNSGLYLIRVRSAKGLNDQLLRMLVTN